jgi:hypothetical protein
MKEIQNIHLYLVRKKKIMNIYIDFKIIIIYRREVNFKKMELISKINSHSLMNGKIKIKINIFVKDAILGLKLIIFTKTILKSTIEMKKWLNVNFVFAKYLILVIVCICKIDILVNKKTQNFI